jgi:hypothetical protein
MLNSPFFGSVLGFIFLIRIIVHRASIMNKDELYACLIELERILGDLITLNYEFQAASYGITTSDYEFQAASYGITTSDSELTYKRHDRLKDNLFDLLVLRLYQLFEIHSILGKTLNQYNKKLIPILKQQWQVIENEKKIIIKWRDELVAHSGKRAKDFQLYVELDPNYFTNIEKILKMSRLAVIYIWSLHANLFTEYQEAWKIRDQKMSNLKHFDITELLTRLIVSEKQYFDDTNKILLANGLKTGIFCGYDDYPMNNTLSNKS